MIRHDQSRETPLSDDDGSFGEPG
ncbi:hypothetical protein BRAS3809_1730013 [Bradyrhizobium sp. STM 3809]|nr:hypothetical protein BRAS3809_1730013 [Bradyrhizobium sp. STM 3809]